MDQHEIGMVELELVQLLARSPTGVIGLFDLGHQIKIGALLAAAPGEAGTRGAPYVETCVADRFGRWIFLYDINETGVAETEGVSAE